MRAYVTAYEAGDKMTTVITDNCRRLQLSVQAITITINYCLPPSGFNPAIGFENNMFRILKPQFSPLELVILHFWLRIRILHVKNLPWDTRAPLETDL